MPGGIRDNASTVAVSAAGARPGSSCQSSASATDWEACRITGTACPATSKKHWGHPQPHHWPRATVATMNPTASAVYPGQEDVGVVDEQDRRGQRATRATSPAVTMTAPIACPTGSRFRPSAPHGTQDVAGSRRRAPDEEQGVNMGMWVPEERSSGRRLSRCGHSGLACFPAAGALAFWYTNQVPPMVVTANAIQSFAAAGRGSPLMSEVAMFGRGWTPGNGLPIMLPVHWFYLRLLCEPEARERMRCSGSDQRRERGELAGGHQAAR